VGGVDSAGPNILALRDFPLGHFLQRDLHKCFEDCKLGGFVKNP
jgi:hypothetical protein